MEAFSRYSRTYLKDAVYAASDGAVAIFALVAGITGASLHFSIVLVLGFANVFADAFSMGTGNFLGYRSEEEMYERQRRIREEEMRSNPQRMRERVEETLEAKGYEGAERTELAERIARDPRFATDFIVGQDLGIFRPEKGKSLRGGIITFFAFMVAGIIPLLPYAAFLQSGISHLFYIAIACTAVELFLLGVLRSFLTDKSWLASGAETLFFGGIAAVIAYIIGAALHGMVSGVPLA